MSKLGTLRIEIKPTGIPEVIAWLEGKFKNAVRLSADEATDDTLTEAKTHAKAGAPVDTGAHRLSIRKERLARPRGYFTYQGLRAGGYVRNPKTGKLVDYSKILEYGSSNRTPRPHIRPAVRRALRKFPDHFYKHLGGRVKLV